MEIQGAASTEVKGIANISAEAKIARLQVALLRKNLDAQEQQAAELLRMLEGKGQNLDLRV